MLLTGFLDGLQHEVFLSACSNVELFLLFSRYGFTDGLACML